MRKNVFLSLVSIVAIVITLSGCNNNQADSQTFDEGNATIISENTWKSDDGITHNITHLTNGNTANKALEESENTTINHLLVDDIPIYEVYSNSANKCNLIFFFHGQGSRKEEYLYEMLNYANEGYLCVTVDLVGHGERISNEEIMSLQVTVDTAKDITTLIDYYKTVSYANADNFALLGLSQGGSVSYWYAAYGKYTPSALIIGSSTPDYNYQNDNTAIQNGQAIDSIWGKEEIKQFISKNNPIKNVDAFINIPLMSGNGLDDEVISYKGAEELEKLMLNAGNTKSQFYYFDNVGHEVTEGFMMKVIPFLNKNM